jgi:pimeloyl-ACP methyl ester carboxylesterase
MPSWILAALLLLECTVAHAAAPLSLAPCEIAGLSQPARCGALDVPENPDRPDGRHVAIQVAVIPARAPASLLDPIVVLMGGPGEDAISSAADFAEQFSSLRQQRDLLLVDQRGTGRSGSLHCDLYSPDNPAASLRDVFPVTAVKSCAQQLSRLADLTQYSYLNFANDLEQVRVALGYGPLNLFSASYGTRAAQVFIRAHPNSVRTVYFSSVVPIDVAIPGPFAVTAQKALNETIDACLADSDCKAAFPQLRAEFAAVDARLQSGQVRTAIPGSTDAAVLDRGRVAEWLRSKLYRPAGAASVPWLIHQAYTGNWQPIAEGILADAQEADADLSFGLFFSITCSGDVAFVRDSAVGAEDRATFFGDYRIRQQKAACRVWPKGAVPKGYRTPIHSAVPAVFASGDADGGTPLWFMEHASKGFSNHVAITQRGQGHTQWSDCVGTIYEQLVRNGSIQGLHTSSCEPIPRPPFQITSSSRQP